MEASPFLPEGEAPQILALKEISEDGESYHFFLDGQESDIKMTRYMCDEHSSTYTYLISSKDQLKFEADVHLSGDSVYIEWMRAHDDMPPEEKESISIAFIESSFDLLVAALRVDFPQSNTIQDELGHIL